MNRTAIVCDTSIFLYLGRIQQIELLPKLYSSVWAPDPVVLELDAGRLLRADTVDPRTLSYVMIAQVNVDTVTMALSRQRLGRGEKAVIAFALQHDAMVAGLDDRQARQAALNLGLHVTGIAGLLVRAKQAGFIESVMDSLTLLQREGFRLSPQTVVKAQSLAGETM